MTRVCLQPGCPHLAGRGGRCPAHARVKERARVAKRGNLYDNQWRVYSEQRRRAQPWCSVCLTPNDLTVDHEAWGLVLCRPCHDRLEVKRRMGKILAKSL